MNVLKWALPPCARTEMPDPPEIRFDVIAAMDRNNGIGKDFVLPWRIPSEFDYFHRMTRNPRTGPSGEARHNAVIIGRKTWETMDRLTQRPYPGALNIVLSRAQVPDVIGFEDTVVCESLDSVVRRIQLETDLDQVSGNPEKLSLGAPQVTGYSYSYRFTGGLAHVIREHCWGFRKNHPECSESFTSVWVFGGAQVYRGTIKSRHFHRLYLTRIDAEFDCDSYFPVDVLAGLRRLGPAEVGDERVPAGRQTDPATGIAYEVFVYERSEP